MSKRLWAAGALAIAVSAAAPAEAAVLSFSFLGGGISGSVALTYGPDTVIGDPAGAFAITGAAGTFSDANIGLSNVAITGVATLLPGTPQSSNKLAPKSFGYLTVASGVQSPEGLVPGFTATNLLYPGGSPPTATDYQFGGGYLDIYGVALTLANGDAVDLWSDGVPPAGALSYGAAVTNRLVPLDYVFTGIAVPEPASLGLLAAGVVGVALRRRRV